MNIAQALKEKNKKAAKIAKLFEKVREYNVCEEGESKPYSSLTLMQEVNKEILELIDLKTRIHKASTSVRDKIFTLSELKNFQKEITYLKTNESLIKNRQTGEVVSKFIAEISAKEREKIMQENEAKIDKIQQELDAFNHTTSI